MNGLRFDFENNDIMLDDSGRFITATTDNQNVALIALSQVCRLTKPEVGAQIGARIINRKPINVSAVLAEAKRMAESDGARNVSIGLDGNNNLIFVGTYDSPN